jgi:Holliday junction resolvase RusA-like endonuclease
MSQLDIVVHGTPAPQGSKRHVGGGRMIESSKAVKPWREAVKWAALDVLMPDAEPLAGPLAVSIWFALTKPASAPKTRRIWPAKRPDLDKLVRSTFDALGEAGVWGDDAQVVSVIASKAYAGDGGALNVPGARIAVSVVEQ